MAAIQRVSTDANQGRVAQLKPGPGNNQYVRASDFNPLVDRVNGLTTTDNALNATTGVNTLGTVVTSKAIVENRTLVNVATTATSGPKQRREG